MKRGLVVGLLLLFVISASLVSFVSASWFNDFFGKNTGKVTDGLCTDSDGGKDIFAKGTTVGLDGQGQISTDTDFCRGNNFYGDGYDYVVEWFCDDSTSFGPGVRFNDNIKCEQGCVDGACLSNENKLKCADDDECQQGYVCNNGECLLSQNETIPSQIKIDSCRSITEPGNYVLTTDLINTEKVCFNIENTHDVNLNCNGHSIDRGIPLRIANVQRFTVENCVVQTSMNLPDQIVFENVQDGIIRNNVIKDTNPVGQATTFDIQNAKHIVVSNNVIEGIIYFTGSNFSLVENNIFRPKASRGVGFAGAILFDEFQGGMGNGNQILNNEIDGGAKGIFDTKDVADDGIVLVNQMNAIVEGNTISNVFDLGIETSGTIQNTKINNNKISNTGLGGIGGWYANDWIDNEVQGNIISETNRLFIFFRSGGLFLDKQKAYFVNNNFAHNVLQNPREGQSWGCGHNEVRGDIFCFNPPFEREMIGERVLTSENYIIEGNIFTENDFSTTLGPYLRPTQGFLDGGGNICSSSNDKNYPLKCNSMGVSSNQTISSNSTPSRSLSEIDSDCSGCSDNDLCYPIGFRKNSEFCSAENKEFVIQLSGDSSCENSFECSSNLCIDSKCVDQGAFQRFLNWLQTLFGSE